jgi:hypothetical protein
MKRCLATILAIIYLSTSMGATVHLHYCMGKLMGWGLLGHSDKDCTFCGMPTNAAAKDCTVAMKGCCRDEHHLIKNKGDQKDALHSFELSKVPVTAADVPYGQWINPFVVSPVLAQPVGNGPPLAGSIPVFLRNCNFRI